jgi:hypothetical protein
LNIKKEVRNFPDGNHVEYATILIDLAYKFIPSIIREEDSTCNEDEIIKGLYVTPTGRITWHTLYLNNRQLAENLVKHLNVIFKKDTETTTR